MALGALASNLIGMLIGSVVQNSGDKQNDNALVQKTVNQIMSKMKKQNNNQGSAPKPILSNINDTNTM